MSWAHFRHGADIGVRGCGDTREEAFAQVALALSAVVADPALIRAEVPIAIRCEAPDDELLLVDWLNALIYEMATRQMLFGRFDVSLTGHALAARAWGEAVNRKRHQPTVEIKGATYTELRVVHCDDGTWLAQTVVDV